MRVFTVETARSMDLNAVLTTAYGMTATSSPGSPYFVLGPGSRDRNNNGVKGESVGSSNLNKTFKKNE